jgi:V-type H+-transporting ATPase subunit d
MSLGGIATFNALHGFPEALVRGYRSGFLKDSDYHHLTQCDTIDDVKLNLSETDYGPYFANDARLTPPIVRARCVDKLVKEFYYLRSHSVAPLTTFLDYLTYEYMIENVMLLLRGTLSGRNVNDLIEQCHPLGMFKESTMRVIPTFEASARGYADLYETVLVDTPVGPYFQKYLDSESASLSSTSEMRAILEETKIEMLKNCLLKYYFEDFYALCESMGGETQELMCSLLRMKADKHSISLTLNSFGTPLNEPALRETERQKLYPSIGNLYPVGVDLLSKVDDDNKLVAMLSVFPLYRSMFEKFLNSSAEDFSIDDEFYRNDVRELELAFEGQMHLAVFYAYFQLKEQEIRNLVWISECILQRMKSQVHKFIPIFSPASSWRCESTRRAAAGVGSSGGN